MTGRLLPGSAAARTTGPGTSAPPVVTEGAATSVRRAPSVTFAGFDGLRAIAALMVVVVHTGFPAGFTTSSRLGPYVARAEAGVAVFFLISGFLLYRPFVAARLAGASPPPPGGYLVRRLMRILPLYWLALAVTLNVVSDERIGVHGLTGVVQTALLVQGYQDTWAIQGLTQAWTLDIEVAFYLAVPVYAWLLGRRRRAPERQVRVELAALAGGYLASRVVHLTVVPLRHGWTSGWNVWLPVWWDLFALGMALAVISARCAQLDRQPRWTGLPAFGFACWAVAALCYWLAVRHSGLPLSPIFTPSRSQDLARHLMYGLFGFFLLLPAVFGPPGRGLIRRLLASRIPVFLGSISYGIYLWHTAVIDLLLDHTSWRIFHIPYVPFLATVLAGTIALATVTHYLVELPCIRLSRGWARRVDAQVGRWTRRSTRPVTPGVPAASTGPLSTLDGPLGAPATAPVTAAARAGVTRVGAPLDAPTVPLGAGPQAWAARGWVAPPPPDTAGLGERDGSEVTARLTRPRRPDGTPQPPRPGGAGRPRPTGGPGGTSTSATGGEVLPVVEPGPPGTRDVGRT
ncbi:acyltransferase family protein [Frankia sp. Ag45/Mut15]|uniref:Acyltransferase family protein n=1 Tax=Frankia umida TaxID=573489 RepID=A0ABT0K5R9_9ACTN|nr:acyltransferase [Frankia umida]MCK9878643.1 acyltransferase family protein [Frankia umida]